MKIRGLVIINQLKMNSCMEMLKYDEKHITIKFNNVRKYEVEIFYCGSKRQMSKQG